MASFDVYITESKSYVTTIEAPTLDDAVKAAANVDTSTLTASNEKSVNVRPAQA